MPGEKGDAAKAASKQGRMAASFMDDCERPACDDMVTMLKAASDRVNKGGTTKENVNTVEKLQKSTETSVQCPPKSAELGRSSWTLLHSMAAWYPDRPSDGEQTLMRQFFSALAQFYPCTYCAADFKENLAKSPVPTESRKDLCVWLCEQHNLVNEKLGKPCVSCDMKTLDERWRKNPSKDCK